MSLAGVLVSTVIPVYRNAASLPDLVGRLRVLAEAYPEYDFEFVFVDDGSPDDSAAVLRALANGEPRIRLLRLSRNFGSNGAIMAGLEACAGDVIAVLAADLQDPPEVIGEMLQRWRSGNKVVLAVRRSRGDPLFTRVMASIFYALFRRLAISTMPPTGFDFFLADRQVVDVLRSIRENNAYLMGLLLWVGFGPVTVAYDRQVREARFGRSAWSLTRKVTYFIDSFVAFSYAPLRLASALGILLSILGAIYAVVVVVDRLRSGAAVQGFAALMVVVLVAAGGQLFMTGVLGEYVWRNLEASRSRPRFIVEEQFGARSALAVGSRRQAVASQSDQARSPQEQESEQVDPGDQQHSRHLARAVRMGEAGDLHDGSCQVGGDGDEGIRGEG